MTSLAEKLFGAKVAKTESRTEKSEKLTDPETFGRLTRFAAGSSQRGEVFEYRPEPIDQQGPFRLTKETVDRAVEEGVDFLLTSETEALRPLLKKRIMNRLKGKTLHDFKDGTAEVVEEITNGSRAKIVRHGWGRGSEVTHNTVMCLGMTGEVADEILKNKAKYSKEEIKAAENYFKNQDYGMEIY